MTMSPALDPKIWEYARVCAFWDRPKLTHEKWLSKIIKGDAVAEKTLTLSMLHMRDTHFVALVGMPLFVEQYPEWRALLTGDTSRSVQQKCLLDSLWSKEVCGTLFVKNPTKEWFNLTKKQRETFYCIADYGLESIYQVAKRMGRNYKRVHLDVKHLIKIGIVQAREKQIKGRRTIIVGL